MKMQLFLPNRHGLKSLLDKAQSCSEARLKKGDLRMCGVMHYLWSQDVTNTLW